MELLLMNLSLSLIFIMMSHPLSLGLILLLQTMLISMITGNYCFNFWFSYILFLILVGGMLILFIYMTSVASNEKFNFNIKNLIPLSILFLWPLIPNFMNWNLNMILNMDLSSFLTINMINLSMNKFINFPLNIILIFLIIYLFLTLIAIVKITNLNYGPLRQMN